MSFAPITLALHQSSIAQILMQVRQAANVITTGPTLACVQLEALLRLKSVIRTAHCSHGAAAREALGDDLRKATNEIRFLCGQYQADVAQRRRRT